MDAIDPEFEPATADEQLGSPGFTFEMGWLAGVLLGTVVVVAAVRRSARRRRAAAPDAPATAVPSSD